jgi:AcrR family transcriptional regulator
MTFVTEPEPDWRQRKKNATRDRIRASALRLFGEQGYDATTVEQIAAAAGVSHMTFFRYFPAKEDVALSDSYDPLLVGLLEQTPAGWPLIDRIRTALLGGLRQLYDTDRDTLLAQNKLIIATPALRERLWASQMDTQQLILQTLATSPGSLCTIGRIRALIFCLLVLSGVRTKARLVRASAGDYVRRVSAPNLRRGSVLTWSTS